MGFMSALTLVFVVLKLTDYIDWSWWLVLLPPLLHVGLAIVIIAIGVIAGGKLAVRKK
jgi:ABC-type antimicrobial peptide transport system permease subunit